MYFKGLTGLRGFAAICVVAHHICGVLLPNLGMWFDEYTRFFSNGYLWVDFFFLLSGFLLCAIYESRFQSASIRYRDFVILRFARIYPLHLLMLFAFLAVQVFYSVRDDVDVFNHNYSAVDFIRHLFLLQAVQIHPTWVTWNGPAWSISAEWWAYVCLPLFLISLSYVRGGLRTCAVWVCCLCALWLLSAWTVHALDLTGYLGFIRCFVEFFAGGVLYRLYHERNLDWIGSTRAQWAILTLLFFVLSLDNYDPIAVALMAVLILSVVAGKGGLTSILESRFFLNAGRISYSIYMVHWFVFIIVEKIGTQGFGLLVYDIQNPVWMLATILITAGLVWIAAEASYNLVERPFRSMIPKIFAVKTSKAKH